MSRMRNLILEMINFDAGEPELIQHLIKVNTFAKMIGELENISEYDMEVLDAATIVHDIGIKVSTDKYGKSNGKLQEQEGPAYAEELLKKLDFEKDIVERVSYLVAHHHTYTNIEGIDYQILVEADFLVNFYENQTDKDTIKKTYMKIFKTKTGKEICKKMFDL